MRYLFKPEIEFLSKKYNLEIEAHYNWLDMEEPNEKSWYCVLILKKIR
jgi:hypothetical protein